jgi:tetratricopeptide (TPR) repeat protein
MGRMDSLGGDIVTHLAVLLPSHPESWYHAALELGYSGRPNDAIDCWVEYVRRAKEYAENNSNKSSGDFASALIWGVECIRDLGVRHQFLDQQYIFEISLKLIKQANKFEVTEQGLQKEIELLNKTQINPMEILRKIENLLIVTGKDSVSVSLSGWLKETHGADEDDFSLQSVADDYAALGEFNDAFRVWSKLPKIKDPSSQVIQLLWYCVNNGIEIDKQIAGEMIFDDESALGDVDGLRSRNSELELLVEEGSKKISDLTMELERVRMAIGQIWTSMGVK